MAENEVYEYLKFGVDLTNKYVNLNREFADYPTDRTACLSVLRAKPEVYVAVPDWLSRYAKGEFKEGWVLENMFSFWIDRSTPKYQIICDTTALPDPTVKVYVPEKPTFWALAAMTETIITAYIKGQIKTVSKGNLQLNDLAHLDKILSIIRRTLVERANVDIASIALEALGEV